MAGICFTHVRISQAVLAPRLSQTIPLRVSLAGQELVQLKKLRKNANK